jgi:hypothetical protein
MYNGGGGARKGRGPNVVVNGVPGSDSDVTVSVSVVSVDGSLSVGSLMDLLLLLWSSLAGAECECPVRGRDGVGVRTNRTSMRGCFFLVDFWASPSSRPRPQQHAHQMMMMATSSPRSAPRMMSPDEVELGWPSSRGRTGLRPRTCRGRNRILGAMAFVTVG